MTSTSLPTDRRATPAQASKRKSARSGATGDAALQAAQNQSWDEEATRTYTEMFDPLVPLVAHTAPAKKIVKEFLTRLRSGKQGAFQLVPPAPGIPYGPENGIKPAHNGCSGLFPICTLGDADLGDQLRQHLGVDRVGFAPGKYRRAEVFGFRISDTPLGPALIMATTEKGDRGSSWYVTADPLSVNPTPNWSNTAGSMPPTELGGYGCTAFQPWHQFVMQIMAKLGQPVDPRYLFPSSHPVVRTWQAARDLLELQQATGPTEQNSDGPKRSVRRRV